MLTRMRIWLPDAPGVLGAVAAEIGAVQGNVIGLEVLEREAGVAIDELVVELPDEPGAVDAVCRGVRNVPGVGVEEVTELVDARRRTARTRSSPPPPAILQARPRPTAAMNALTGHLDGALRPDLAGAGRRRAARLRRGARRGRPVGAVGGGVRRGLAQWRRPGQRHHRLGRVRRARSRDRAHRVRRPARAPSGAGSATRSRCWSWWRRASWTRWRASGARADGTDTPDDDWRAPPSLPPCCVSASSAPVSSPGRTAWASRP